MLPVAVWFDLRSLSSESLARQARELNSMVTDIRKYYSSNVVARVLENHGSTKPTHNYKDEAGGIPIPATLSIELGNVIGGRTDRISYRFVSDEPFRGRQEHNLDEFEKDALAQLRTLGKSDSDVTRVTGSLLDRQVRMAVPVIMGAACVSCHNSHADSPRTDWKVGDIRGIQAITIDQRIAANLFSFKFLLIYFVAAGFIGVLFLSLQWRRATEFATMNAELEEANSFLAAISMKISKYLSPQIYKSIFSGEKDAIIATERKKLTIFFSDIKDFTAATERLQPEELTTLLNEYFTEMAKIAHSHGATVDKFIGDAILAFFGDPETKGPKEDALACVRMAVDMQKRLNELSLEWRRRGFEKPLQARMGINTGYCNVGNFGSEDRMDYTIIGAEANVAARLESIAEPGGIVMSYETYALVQDYVTATPIEPIALKGISRDVIPYVVDTKEGLSDEDASEVLEVTDDRLSLYVNLAGSSDADRQEIEKRLSSALKAVQEKG
ncbi:MAG: adenylate/guanylate cyclase domain-containing protein [Stappiaceae bacterium]